MRVIGPTIGIGSANISKSFHHPSQYEFFPTTLYVIICFEWYPLKYSVPPSAPPLEQCVHCVFIIANIISAWRFIYYHNPMKLSERDRVWGGDVGKREGGGSIRSGEGRKRKGGRERASIGTMENRESDRVSVGWGK